MDEKKVREAIEVIKGYRRLDEYMNNTERLPYCDMAIEALEKQLPKKPEEVVGAIYGISYECKNCGSEIEPLDIYADYCKWCGQRLDWTKSYTRFIQDSNKS